MDGLKKPEKNKTKNRNRTVKNTDRNNDSVCDETWKQSIVSVRRSNVDGTERPHPPLLRTLHNSTNKGGNDAAAPGDAPADAAGGDDAGPAMVERGRGWGSADATDAR